MNTHHDDHDDAGLASPASQPTSPVASTGGVGIPPVVSAPEEPTPKRRVSRLVAAAVLGLVLVVAVGGWLVFRNRGEHDGSRSAAAKPDRLAIEPQQELYSVSLDDAANGSIRWLVGSPDHLIANVGWEELRVFGGDGTELWRREFDDKLSIFELIGGSRNDDDRDDEGMDDVLVGTPGSDDEQGTVALLDGATGADLWSISVDAYISGAVTDREVVVVRHDASRESIESGGPYEVHVYDLATGEQIASRMFESVASSAEWGDGDLHLVVQDQGELVVVDRTLKVVSEAIPAPNDSYVALYQGDAVVVVGDEKLIRYGIDGKEITRFDFDVDLVRGFDQIADGAWLFWTSVGECGAVRVDDITAKVLWQIDDCWVSPRHPVVRIGDDSYVALLVGAESDSEGVLVNALTGERVFSKSKGSIVLFENGFVARDRTEFTAYELPGVKKMYSVPLDRTQAYRPLDNGYATYPDDPDAAPEFTVFG